MKIFFRYLYSYFYTYGFTYLIGTIVSPLSTYGFGFVHELATVHADQYDPLFFRELYTRLNEKHIPSPSTVVKSPILS